ncbi:MAG: hypothetical protein II726_02300, partial [Elusimicrobiaceae bacterium]|nr:hypothetical protein [Elusimicrobiaceae bacterium]
ESANNEVPLVKAIRKKGGNNIYGIYKNLQTGDMLCEDMVTTDYITCDLFYIGKQVKSCEDGSMINEGEQCTDPRKAECESQSHCYWHPSTESCDCEQK